MPITILSETGTVDLPEEIKIKSTLLVFSMKFRITQTDSIMQFFSFQKSSPESLHKDVVGFLADRFQQPAKSTSSQGSTLDPIANGRLTLKYACPTHPQSVACTSTRIAGTWGLVLVVDRATNQAGMDGPFTSDGTDSKSSLEIRVKGKS